MFRLLFLALLLHSSAAFANPGDFRADNIVYCSDGEFDWDSGQSLYDFVILLQEDGDFLISYLGIPHPNYEIRDFNHFWMKLKGQFSAETIATQSQSGYRLRINIEGEEPRQGNLVIAEDGLYTYTMTPALPFPTTTSGLCWDSLAPDPSDDEIKSKR
ncbi:hypothetical protein OAI46_02555 [Alphaproteobacteria bacterium]|nr:hypothetical protein [Alphaproteobacteria bacterium]MDC0147736.1 hypothetical protein [Alphaproteobacteria bacterium]